MSGDWPPEWHDQGAEEEFLSEADEARLAEVTAYLSSVPAPTLPEAIEARISAALTAEAASRATASGPGAVDPAGGDGPRTLGPRTLGPRSRFGRHRNGRHPERRTFRTRPLLAAASVLVCLILAGLGYGLSRGGPTGRPSNVSAAGSASGSAPVSPVGGAVSGAQRLPQNGLAKSPGPSKLVGGSGATAPAPAASVPFVVTTSGTNYQAATLAAQVAARLNVPLAGTAPSAVLVGCVSQLTRGQSPRLVDQATYQGSPAYVIATATRAWVVGLGCTAANTALITSAPLGA